MFWAFWDMNSRFPFPGEFSGAGQNGSYLLRRGDWYREQSNRPYLQGPGNRRSLHCNALLRSIPAQMAGCPTSRSFFARCGIPQASPSSLLRHPQLPSGCPMFAPALPGFPTTRHLPRPRMRLSLKESRRNLLNATNLDRKSGIRGPKTMGEAHQSLSFRTLPFVPWGRNQA
jgi:hypothetical protein